LPELQQVQGLFAVKYGKEFAAAATELRPDCGVNRRVMSYHMLSYCFL
jgi:vacuolar protein sorting-associated protein IST1